MKTNKRSPSERRLRSQTELEFVQEWGWKISLHFLAGILSCLLSAQVTFGFPQKAKNGDSQTAAPSIAGKVAVITGQGQSQVNNLAGVAVNLSSPDAGFAVQSTLTDESARLQFTQLAAGTYTL